LSRLGLDTSVAVPLLVQTHVSHSEVAEWWDGREVALCGHALAETYSVLTRLPGDLRLGPADAARLISERFTEPLLLGRRTSRQLPAILAELKIAGGAVYDAMVGLAAAEHHAALATRDNRARGTYELVGAHVLLAMPATST
jgi:predicted nucleic acid-binding protein